MTTPIHDKIIKLISLNIPQHRVAEATGVSESYISQLLTAEGVAEKIADLKSAQLERLVEKEETITEVAAAALRRIKATIPFAKSALEAARVWQILESKNTSIADPAAADASVDRVTIVLPKAAAISIQLNNQNQVIDIDGRSMATLPSRALPKFATDVKVKSTNLKERQEEADKQIAASKLKAIEDRTIVIDGVPCVI